MRQLILLANAIVNRLTILVAAIALLVFLWGIAQTILKRGDEKAVEAGKNIAIWGIIALFVMVSVWGLVNFLRGAIGLQVNEPLQGTTDYSGGDTLGPGGSNNWQNNGCYDSSGNPTYAGDCGTF